MSRSEVAQLVAWAAQEGWNPGLHDARLFWATDLEAFIAADLDGELIGGGDSAVISATPIPDTPSGDAEVVRFKLLGYEFMSLSAGPIFRINPSVSFIVNFDTSQRTEAKEALETLWGKLAAGGTVFMPLASYPFSERYGWVQDKFGVSCQLILSSPAGDPRPYIIPSLMLPTR